MTNEELEEYARNAHAQAAGAQHVLLALMTALLRHGTDRAIIKEAFDHAADTFVAASYSDNVFARRIAPDVLQVVDDMRKSVIGKD